MTTYLAQIERCSETGDYVGSITGLPRAYTCGKTIEELMANLREVIELVIDKDEFRFDIRIDSISDAPNDWRK